MLCFTNSRESVCVCVREMWIQRVQKNRTRLRRDRELASLLFKKALPHEKTYLMNHIKLRHLSIFFRDQISLSLSLSLLFFFLNGSRIRKIRYVSSGTGSLIEISVEHSSTVTHYELCVVVDMNVCVCVCVCVCVFGWVSF